MDGSAVEECDAISDCNIARKLSQKGCVAGVMTGTEDNVLALPDSDEEAETLCQLLVRRRLNRKGSCWMNLPRILLSAASLPGPISMKSNNA